MPKKLPEGMSEEDKAKRKREQTAERQRRFQAKLKEAEAANLNLEQEPEDVCHVKSSEQEKLLELKAECDRLKGELLKKDSQLNDQMKSQIAALQNEHESRIRELNQKFLTKEAECANLNDVIARKNTEMQALESRLNDQMNSQIAALQNKHESRIRELNEEISRVKSSELELKTECANLNDVMVEENWELKTFKAVMGVKVLNLEQDTIDMGEELRELMDLNAVENILFATDSYKVTHHEQYPEGTTHVYSYFESQDGKFDQTCFFGLQYILKRWLVGPVINSEMVQQAKYFYRVHSGGMDVFNEKGWMHIVKEHEGKLPLRIKAVPEGTVVPVGNVLFTIENTDPKVPWLVSWVEALLVQVWYPMTVATSSRTQKEMIAKGLLETSNSLDGLPFKLYDFGFRGCSSVESAGIGGAAHLVNFVGTDTMAGLQLCRKYYHAKMADFSIPAAEHSTITALEKSAISNLSVVSDSIVNDSLVSDGDELKSYVLERAEKGCLVIRPDSGNPCEVVVKVLNLLAEKYPISENSEGYRVLPPYLRVMQGDGISLESLQQVIDAMKSAGWSLQNVIFGTGGALLQKLDRDTQKCAYKCSHVTINEEGHDVCKNPTTDAGKRSKKAKKKDELVCVFENGRLLVDHTLDKIRERAELPTVREFNQSQKKKKNAKDT